jgi:hypothetical protein
MTAPPLQEIESLQPREALSAAQRDEMFGLPSRYFEGVTREQFENDLAEKNWVVEIRRDDRLMGFSTLLVREVAFEGDVLTAIYSGDTIVAPEAWGTPALARNWIAAVNQLRAAAPGRPCYWLLLTSGFRTYRFLPVFWRNYFPGQAAPTPPREQRLLDHLARMQYGSSYDATAGIVRFLRPQKLCPQLGGIPQGRAADVHVSFFLRHNPGHSQGDELVCLTRIDDANLTSAGRRIVASTRR